MHRSAPLAPPNLGFGHPSFRGRRIGSDRNERVEYGIELFDLSEARIGQLDW